MIFIENLYKSFKKENAEPVSAVNNISLHIARGEFVAIVGPSGSGKTSLMNILGLLDIPDSGSYLFEGKEISKMKVDDLAEIRNKKIGFVFQQFHLLPKVSAKENVELPLIYSDKTDIDGLAEKALIQVGLKERMHHTSSELSGGQQQRVAIARALVNNPEVILADEPTGNLDSATSEEIIGIFNQLHAKGKTIILITHDMIKASSAQKIIRIVDGKITEEILNRRSKN
jgi:putative ABC transport system ATP-binding protein